MKGDTGIGYYPFFNFFVGIKVNSLIVGSDGKSFETVSICGIVLCRASKLGKQT